MKEALKELIETCKRRELLRGNAIRTSSEIGAKWHGPRLGGPRVGHLQRRVWPYQRSPALDLQVLVTRRSRIQPENPENISKS